MQKVFSFENAHGGPKSKPGDPVALWKPLQCHVAPMCPLPMTTLPQPLCSPLTWDGGPAHSTGGVTGVQRGGGWTGPEPRAQVPVWVLCLAGPTEAWSWQAHQLLCRGLAQQLCVLRTP